MGRDQAQGLVTVVLNAVSLASLVVATAAVAFVALVRRRIRLALVATVLVAGANLTCQVLKDYVIGRPDLGIAGTDIGAPNSMPSGHVTVAASISVAAVLVLPPRLRGLAAVLGTVYLSLTGIATLSPGGTGRATPWPRSSSSGSGPPRPDICSSWVSATSPFASRPTHTTARSPGSAWSAGRSWWSRSSPSGSPTEAG